MSFQLRGDRDNPSVSCSDIAYTIPANPMSDRGQAVCVRNSYGIDMQGGKGTANYGKEVSQTLAAIPHGTPHSVAYELEKEDEKQENLHRRCFINIDNEKQNTDRIRSENSANAAISDSKRSGGVR